MMKKVFTVTVCCAALGGLSLQAQDTTPLPSATGSPGTRSPSGYEPSNTDSTAGSKSNPKTNKVEHARRTDTKSGTSATTDATGSSGPSTGGYPQTNSTYGGPSNICGQATVGSTSNRNPKASTGNMNPEGSATGQSTGDGMDGTTHKTGKARRHHKKQQSDDTSSPSGSPTASASPGT
jgi:hypothetical protein